MNIDTTVTCGATRDWHVELTVSLRARTATEIRPTEGSILYVVVEDESGSVISEEYLSDGTTLHLRRGQSRSYTYSLDELVSDTDYTVSVYAVGLFLPLGTDDQQLTETTVNPA